MILILGGVSAGNSTLCKRSRCVFDHSTHVRLSQTFLLQKQKHRLSAKISYFKSRKRNEMLLLHFISIFYFIGVTLHLRWAFCCLRGTTSKVTTSKFPTGKKITLENRS